MHARLRNLIAAVGAAALVVVSSSSAGAVAPAPVSGGPAGQGVCAAQALAARTHLTVAAMRAFGDCEIARRLKTLTGLSAFVNGSRALTASDRAALIAEIQSEASGLASLEATIDGQASLPALRLEVVQVASKYRVYVLTAPQAYLVGAADAVLAMQPALTQLASTLAGRIAAARAAGDDVSAAQVSLDAMTTEIAAAMGQASPLPGRLLALTAASWNSGTAPGVLKASRAALVSARGHLSNAVKLGRAVISALS
jgi:hypothetical protein